MQVWILLRHLDQKITAKVGFHNSGFKEPKQSRSRIKLSANLERLEASTRGERGPGLWCVRWGCVETLMRVCKETVTVNCSLILCVREGSLY